MVLFLIVICIYSQAGSIAAVGGRYDNLIRNVSRKGVAAIGVNLGYERVFTICKQ